MSFRQAESYLLGTINETISRRLPYRLERMNAFMHELGNPERAFPSVHVAGTSGKGSTSTMIAAALQSSGMRVGLHTKPHLRSMTERARIDGVPVPEERFAELLAQMMPAIERTTQAHGRPTYYETLLALTFSYFAQERVDIAAIEVGLGGALDGTNVIVPQVGVITSIGFDHMDVLGETIEEIAREKAGIAKAGVPLIIAVEDPKARAVIEAHAASVGAPVVRVDRSARIEGYQPERLGQRFLVTTGRAEYAIELPVLGEFQRANAATAIVALEALDSALRPSRERIEAGFATLALPGRMELFTGHPPVVFDIAHNAEKAQHLVASLRERFPDQRFSFVVAIGESKDAAEILRAFASLRAAFTFTTFKAAGRQAIRPARLVSIAESIGSWGRAIEDPLEALAIARRTAASGDDVDVTGSTFVVAELRAWWLNNVMASETLHV
ncbi:MAG: bifunctional folylpolyglutamate synthase/dihydrofolate synthase [Vulcanimicrobiaceae bacterium]